MKRGVVSPKRRGGATRLYGSGAAQRPAHRATDIQVPKPYEKANDSQDGAEYVHIRYETAAQDPPHGAKDGPAVGKYNIK